MHNKILSIIVPIFNTEFEYLIPCLNSIRNIVGDIQVILINDGSSNEYTQELVILKQKYGDFELYHKINGGQNSARSFGLKFAKAKYIWFVDSDDRINYKYVSDCLLYISKNPIDALVFDHEICRNNQKPVKYTNWINNKHQEVLSFENSMKGHSLWSVIFKRTIIQSPHFCLFENIHVAEDLISRYVILSLADRIVLWKQPLYTYVIRGTSVMNNRDIDSLKDPLTAFITLKDYLGEIKFEKVFYTLAIEHIIFWGGVNILCNTLISWSMKKKILLDIYNGMNYEFPKWRQYINHVNLSKKQRLLLFFIANKYWLLAFSLILIRNK